MQRIGYTVPDGQMLYIQFPIYIYNVSMGAMPPQLVLRVKHITHP